jgi:glutamate N-acetyltransferase/amino-acid N-acetyltransferase
MKRARATSTITVPGFQFAAVACGIKKSGNKDLAVIYSERPAPAAALFTTNRIKAAPVLLGMERMKGRKLQAVVVSSGNANACTGSGGLRDAETMCRETGRHLGISPDLVLPSSTGLIGVPLPMEKVRRGIQAACAALSPKGFSQAAEAILTTDRFAKTAATTFRLSGRKVTLAGMAKGAGMIAPHMATMLGYILTDAAVAPDCLRSVLSRAAEDTFNAVTVDGDTSTNDTLLFLANGAAGNPAVRKGSAEERSLFKAAQEVMKRLALQLVEDGEGATKVVEIRVEGARSTEEARKVARAVADSNLVKTAFFGEDPNYGRIMAAAGCAGVALETEKVSVFFEKVPVVRKGAGVNSNEREAARVLKRPSFCVRVQLGLGKATASVWTSDLGHEYVRINSAYRT